MQAAADGRIVARRARRPLRRGRPRHAAPLRGDRLAGDHGRRAAQAELRDLPGRRPRPTSRRAASRSRSRTATRASCRSSPAGPFRYATPGVVVPRRGRARHQRQLKQAVISASALSLLYPGDGIDGLPARRVHRGPRGPGGRRAARHRGRGATAQIDFTEARLSLKLDPSGGLLDAFVDLNNLVLDRLTDEERAKVGVHTCPGGDQDSTHSADIDYADAAARRCSGSTSTGSSSSSPARPTGRGCSGSSASRPRATAGSSSASSTRSTRASRPPDEVADRVLEAARFIDPDHLGTTDDCGFSPFGDDMSTSRDTAFAKIAARVEGTRIASERLGV